MRRVGRASTFGSRRRRGRQRLLPFLDRSLRAERRFKIATLALTALVLGAIVVAAPTGRRALWWFAIRTRWAAMRAIGEDPRREEIVAAWRERRRQGIEETRASAAEALEHAPAGFRRLVTLAGMMPGDAVIRWGNFNRTFLLSSKVFAPDDTGRSYRMLPHVRSVWLKQRVLPKPDTGQLLIPDTPEIRRAVGEGGAELMPGSEQTTNSWGCRGAEPDLEAPLRGLVIGDSYMQGLFVDDDHTPPVCLEKKLCAGLGVRTSVLNTGVLGYSPEQYYATLREFSERFRPHFVVVSVFSNDFGFETEAFGGSDDWSEGEYWLGQIRVYCQSRQIPYLITPIVGAAQLISTRTNHGYPSRVASIAHVSTESYLDPIEEFLNEHLRLRAQTPPGHSGFLEYPLYNHHVGDGHFSPRGAALWAEVVSRRLIPLLKVRKAVQASPTDPPEPPSR